MLRAWSGSRIAVRPGVARTALSHASSGEDDDEPIWLRPLARGLHAREFLQPLVHDLALDGRHRLELDALTLACTLGAANRDGLERDAATLPVARRVDGHRFVHTRAM